MSTIYFDAAGNKYLGDCQWGNHDINYPTTNFLSTGCVFSEISSDITAILLNSGLLNGGVLPQTTINTWTTATQTLVSFAPNGDSINNRFSFSRKYLITDSSGSGGNEILTLHRLDNGSNGAIAYSGTAHLNLANSTSGVQLIGCGNADSLSLFIFQSSGAIPNGNRTFWFGGKLLDVNTNFNYYNSSNNTRCCVLGIYTGNNLFNSVLGSHYIAGSNKSLLQTDRAIYTISCSDGQTPGAQWATDMWVYDNNATLGYPVIGRVPNMLLGIGTYTYLKPVKIQGSVFPDNGSPWYLPVGTFAEKTLLMRCYSSIT